MYFNDSLVQNLVKRTIKYSACDKGFMQLTVTPNSRPDVCKENWSSCECTCDSSNWDHATGYIHYFTVTYIVTDIAINGNNEEFRGFF